MTKVIVIATALLISTTPLIATGKTGAEKYHLKTELSCISGPEVTGPDNRWSPWATCPKGYTPVGIAKLDLLGKHNGPTLHINDLRCQDEGCKAWCIGAACRLKSRCCKVTFKGG